MTAPHILAVLSTSDTTDAPVEAVHEQSEQPLFLVVKAITEQSRLSAATEYGPLAVGEFDTGNFESCAPLGAIGHVDGPLVGFDDLLNDT